MGRPLIIIVGGLIVLFGLVQLGAWQRIDLLNHMNVNQYQETDLRNQAMGGLDLGLRMFNQDRVEPSVIEQVSLTRGNANVKLSLLTPLEDLSLSDGQVRIVSLASDPFNRQYETSAIVIFGGDVDFPTVHGAIGVYDENTVLRFHGVGNDAKVDGNDLAGEEDALPGIVAVRSYDDVVETSGNANIEIDGADGDEEAGDHSFAHNPGLDADELDYYYNRYVENGQLFNENNYGTLNEPQVMIMPEGETTRINNITDLGGVIVVPTGAVLNLRGKTEFYGLIINYGKMQVGGTVKIEGGLMMGGEAEAEVDEDEDIFGGTPTVKYNSEVFNTMSQSISNIIGTPEVIAIRN